MIVKRQKMYGGLFSSKYDPYETEEWKKKRFDSGFYDEASNLVDEIL